MRPKPCCRASSQHRTKAAFAEAMAPSGGAGASGPPSTTTQPPSLALAPYFAAQLRRRLPAWRRVVSAATGAGLAVPGLSASLAFFDTLTTARGSADLIQAQRDYFGSHGYERVDAPGVPVHTDWTHAKRLA